MNQSVLILDGGLGSELENQGIDVGSSLLWSAQVLVTNPTILEKIHRQYYEQGADVVTTASYQASIPGFIRYFKESGFAGGDVGSDYEGLAKKYIGLSVTVAQQARDKFWAEYIKLNDNNNREVRSKPLVAASVGPYGAFLGKGEEYTGRYNLPASDPKSEEIIGKFHKERLDALLVTEPDIIAIETIPNELELKVLQSVLFEASNEWKKNKTTPFPKVWLALSLDTTNYDKLADGTSFSEVLNLVFPPSSDESFYVDAIGINCLPPHNVKPALQTLRDTVISHASDINCPNLASIPFIVYPNSGEIYDGITKEWQPNPTIGNDEKEDTETKHQHKCFDKYLKDWYDSGARIIGGCCRTGPKDTFEIRQQLQKYT